MNNFGIRYGFFGNSLAAISSLVDFVSITGGYAMRLSGSIPSGHPKYRSPETERL